MSIWVALQERSGLKCELCVAVGALLVFVAPPDAGGDAGKCVQICSSREGQLAGTESVNANPEHLEGKASGQKIVIFTKFVKK